MSKNKKIRPKNDVACKMVKRFCVYVMDLKATHRIETGLFWNDKGQKLIEQTAESFFKDINRILIEYFILESAKITDPAKSFGKHENFSVANLIKTIDWSEDILEKLCQLKDKTDKFREKIKDARNKLLAHLSREEFLSDSVLGEFKKDDAENFLKTLEEIGDVMHKASFDETFGAISTAEEGDVMCFKKVLTKALAFDKVREENNGEEGRKLLHCWNDLNKQYFSSPSD
jgi:uncharacterized protein with von Willebrand factor type A (vWA) domain